MLTRTLGAVALATALTACSSTPSTSGDDPASQEEPTTSASSAEPTADEPVEEQSDECLKVSPKLAKGIAKGEESGVGMKPGRAVAVKSPDFDKVYFIAMEFGATGIEDQVGVWASNSLKPGGGVILAVDGFAKEFTVWPDADKTDAAIDGADPSADAAIACLN